MNATLKRPEAKESNQYYHKYIGLVGQDDFLTAMENAMPETAAFLNTLNAEQWDYRYAEGKWSIKEVMLHSIDTERVMAYRALRIARNDQTPLPGFDENEYIPFADAENRSPKSIIEEYKAVRKSSIEMFKNFNDDMLGRFGTANGNPFTP